MGNFTKSNLKWIKSPQLILSFILLCFFLTGSTQTLPGSYTTSWAGNTFATTAANPNNFVQNWANNSYSFFSTNQYWKSLLQ